ncbi:unnamed protein product [Rotaria sp. Silwood2]|nr:unnamed protein product [Rotaria sp. Silwood2]
MVQFTNTPMKIIYGTCAFLSLLALLLVIIGVATPNWIVSTFNITPTDNTTSFGAYLGFFKFCYDGPSGACISLSTPISTPAGLLIFGIILLGFSIIVCLVVGVIKFSSTGVTFVPLIILFLASIFIIGGYAISWYYLYSSVQTTLATTIVQYNINIAPSQLLSLIQGAQAGYSYNLAVAGHFFTYVALAIAAYGTGFARNATDL